MRHQLNQLDESTRRQFMAATAKSLLGVSVLPFAGRFASAAEPNAQAKHLIYLFMNGAMSQIDTFDPKPKSKSQGPTGVIKTRTTGVQFGEYLPKLAARSKHLAVVRSMTTSTGAHAPGRYLMRTNYKSIASTKHPSLGAFMQRLAGRSHPVLPSSVQIGGGGIGPGYLGAKFAPVPVGDPEKGLQNTKPPEYLTRANFDRRMELAKIFDEDFKIKATAAEVRGYDDLYTEAISLLKSKDLAAFDITREPEKARSMYGNSKFAKGCLLARRLIEHGVRSVEVSLGSWDHHNSITEGLQSRAPDLDNAMSALLDDLEARGLLDETLVVVATEFGRKPKMNQNEGRDHHPAAFSCVLAGGGIRGGQVYGETDEDAFSVADNEVMVKDFNATIAKAMGMPISEEINSADGRPFTIANGGEPIEDLL